MTQTDAARLGILMLETRFPRILGDIGNAATWPFEVRYSVVAGAGASQVVRQDASAVLPAFIAEGRKLIAEGCTGIATTCGFLSRYRPQLAEALGVPVAASALEQAGQVAASMDTDKRLGILTISKTALSPEHLQVAGVPEGTPVVGMEGSSFARTILTDLPDLDVTAAEQEMVARALDLTQAHPDVGAIILKCTNMVPYAPRIAAATGRPVYSIYSYLLWFHAGLVPRNYA